MDTTEVINWVIIALAVTVSLLTLYNAARLRTGVLAISTYAFGGGMLCLSAAFFLLSVPALADAVTVGLAYRVLFIAGFVLLGFGSFKIYLMSRA